MTPRTPGTTKPAVRDPGGQDTAVTSALLEVQKACPPLVFDATNPHFRSSYVSLGGLMDTVLPILNEHGVLLTQAPTNDEAGNPILVTMLCHAESGERITAFTPLYMEKVSAQAHGSAITYARRYALMSLLGLVGDEDDDGNAASASAREESMGEARGRQAQAEQREFDPGRDLLPTAIRVTTEDDAVAVRQAQWALAPDENWPAVETYLSESVFGVPYEGLDNAGKREFWTRLTNATIKAQDLAGPGGDFPPPTFEQVEEAYAWAFKGTRIVLQRPEDATGDDLSPSEPEAEPEDPAPEEAAEEAAEGDETQEGDDDGPPGMGGPSEDGMA